VGIFLGEAHGDVFRKARNATSSVATLLARDEDDRRGTPGDPCRFDSIDEELEMELDDRILAALLAEHRAEDAIDRRFYFSELPIGAWRLAG
jgi:hypothetical protein